MKNPPFGSLVATGQTRFAVPPSTASGTDESTILQPRTILQPFDPMEIIYVGGPLDGREETVTRDRTQTIFGAHYGPNQPAIFDRYIRICAIWGGRTVFIHKGTHLLRPPKRSLLARLLLRLGLKKPKVATIE